jgi:hypothetical protein
MIAPNKRAAEKSRRTWGLTLALVLFAADTSLAEPLGERVVRGAVRDAQARPLRAEIAFDHSPLIFDKRSDEQGRFEIVVPAGTEGLVFSSSGYQDQRVAISLEDKPITVVLEEGAEIRVAVLTSEGRPYRAAVACAKKEDVSGSETDTCEMEQATGSFCSFEGIPAGRYRVWVCGHPNIPSRLVDVVPRHPAVLTLRQPKGTTLRVLVMDKSGERVDPFLGLQLIQGKVSYPESDAAFKAAEAGMFWSDSRSASNKSRVFTGLASGEYTIMVTPPRCGDNVPVSESVVVPRRGSTTVTVRLPYAYHECP